MGGEATHQERYNQSLRLYRVEPEIVETLNMHASRVMGAARAQARAKNEKCTRRGLPGPTEAPISVNGRILTFP